MVRWTVLVVTPGAGVQGAAVTVAPVELPTSRPAVVGRGRTASIELDDPAVSERHLSLAVRDDGVVVELFRGAGEALLNDVQLTGPAVLRAGDELRVGGSRLVVMGVASSPPPRPRLASHDELTARLGEELARAGLSRPVGFVLVAQPALNVAARQALTRRVVDEVTRSGAVACWGELTGEVLGGVVPELPRPELEAVLARLPGVAGPRAQVAAAQSPEDGLDAESMIEAAFERLSGNEPGALERDPVVTDAFMVRLASIVDLLAGSREPVLAVGPRGSGRATLLGPLAPGSSKTAGRAAAVHAGDSAKLTRLIDQGGVVLVRELGLLPKESVDALLDRAAERKTRVLATSTTRLARFPAVLEVPPLHARPEDILPLAAHFVTQARVQLGRPRLVLGAEARQLLAAWRWPGNVRELKNVMTRAVRASVRDEVGRDALPARLSADAPAETLRGALKATERELLLEALARTRWNVSAAATRLGLPRRTVVYRMSRLGLKRPAR